MLIHGKCHCGNISFGLNWEPEPLEIPTRRCGCSFCTKHRAAWTSHRSGTLRVELLDPERVTPYAFGTRTAEFQVCADCGVVPLVTSRIDGHLYAVVNVNTFENVAPSLLRPTAVSFDGEGTESRLARRARNWIADVSFQRAR
jgi:hypothetical protein